MNKPRIAQVLGVEVGEEFTYDFGANQVNRGAFKDEAKPENWPNLIHCGSIHDGEGGQHEQ